MRHIPLTLLLAAAPAGLAATTVAAGDTIIAVGDTIVNVARPDNVVITENGRSVNVKIKGKENDSTFRFEYSKEIGEDATETLVQRADSWDFSLPLMKKNRKGDKEDGNDRLSTGTGGFGFGFVQALGAPSQMKVDMASSYEIFVTILSFNGYKKTFNGKHKISVGFGLNWRNYRMTGNCRFLKEDGHIRVVPYPEGAEADFSRLKIFSLTVPFRYTYSFARHWRASGAAILNFNTYGSLKTRYRAEGKKAKDFSKRIHQKPASLDLMGSLSWRGFGLYVKYTPFDVLQTDFGPKFSGISTGFVLGF